MADALILGGGLILVAFVGAQFMDATFGQPRHSGGEFAPMRTTQLKNLVVLALLAMLVLYLIFYV
ncbi:hypothetical protein [Halorientalis regularis]|jgi:hypothetical protein|uniref:HIG1 domain-containing protein n=1 Tax=Halorientalis regularis TaxID=660518 RepID=A0A1G7U6I2_9EURY|nr:hypothetical protein [Halorientalis regularis]SDG43034.1 hypothetical protein SAMN05216218_1405 [Halorientalis regularis]